MFLSKLFSISYFTLSSSISLFVQNVTYSFFTPSCKKVASFDSSINFSNYSGSLNLLSGCSFDNISFFKSNGLGESGVTIARVWSDVLYGDQEQDPLNIVDWQYWYDENGLLTIPREWKDVYVLDESVSSSITPKQIYETYMGTNIVVVDDNSGVSLVNDDFTMFADQTWLKIVDKPA